MTNDRQERIGQRAYQIWEAAGQPDGEYEAHWRQAEHEIDEEVAALERSEAKSDSDNDAEALRMAETTDLSPNQAKELLKKHRNDPEKLKDEAENFKAES